jgi:hypothetical protein
MEKDHVFYACADPVATAPGLYNLLSRYDFYRKAACLFKILKPPKSSTELHAFGYTHSAGARRSSNRFGSNEPRWTNRKH